MGLCANKHRQPRALAIWVHWVVGSFSSIFCLLFSSRTWKSSSSSSPHPLLESCREWDMFLYMLLFSRLLVEVVQGFLFFPPFLFFLLSNYNFICVVRMCVCMWVHVPWCVSRGQSTTRVIRFSPSTMWVLRIRLTLSGSVANAAISWAIFPSPSLLPSSSSPFVVATRHEVSHIFSFKNIIY